MKISKTVVCIISFLLLLSVNATASIHESLVSEYIELSGIAEVLSTYPEQLAGIANQNRMTSQTPERDKKLHEILVNSFDLGQAENELYFYLLENTDPAHLSKLIEWLKSPTGRKIKEEQVASTSPLEQANMLRYLADLQSDPPTQERINALNALEDATKTSELIANITVDMTKGMFGAIGKSMSEEKLADFKEVEEQIVEMKPVIEASMRQKIVLMSFYTYRNITDEEIQAYTELYKSETGKKEIEIVGSALSKILTTWLSAAGEKIASFVDEEKKSEPIN